ncbi:MAG TPA: hypothetical protein VNK92_04790 [Vicinamibacterales bacterium]|jgi:hypothetical protein|nr:hypothetical protein [Vicinamibacterales bacterium]
MAKTRPKPVRRRRPARKRPVRRPRRVELRPIRRLIDARLEELAAAEQTKKVRDAIRRLRRCLAEIDEICGPEMTVPLV